MKKIIIISLIASFSFCMSACKVEETSISEILNTTSELITTKEETKASTTVAETTVETTATISEETVTTSETKPETTIETQAEITQADNSVNIEYKKVLDEYEEVADKYYNLITTLRDNLKNASSPKEKFDILMDANVDDMQKQIEEVVTKLGNFDITKLSKSDMEYAKGLLESIKPKIDQIHDILDEINELIKP